MLAFAEVVSLRLDRTEGDAAEAVDLEDALSAILVGDDIDVCAPSQRGPKRIQQCLIPDSLPVPI
jgi:hypothetical protein